MKRILLLIAGITGLAILIGGTWLYFNRDRIANFAMDRALKMVEGRVIAELPAGISADSIKTEFEALHKLLQSGSVSIDEIKTLATDYQEKMKDERLDSAEVKKLVADVKELLSRHKAIDSRR
jgi:hypothetical protein